MPDYKPLAEAYRKNGFDYALLARTPRVALYQQRDADSPGFEAFEVCRVLRHDGRTIGGQTLPPAEFLPSTEQWGQQAWSYRDEATARAKYAEQDAHLLETATA